MSKSLLLGHIHRLSNPFTQERVHIYSMYKHCRKQRRQFFAYRHYFQCKWLGFFPPSLFFCFCNNVSFFFFCSTHSCIGARHCTPAEVNDFISFPLIKTPFFLLPYSFLVERSYVTYISPLLPCMHSVHTIQHAVSFQKSPSVLPFFVLFSFTSAHYNGLLCAQNIYGSRFRFGLNGKIEVMVFETGEGDVKQQWPRFRVQIKCIGEVCWRLKSVCEYTGCLRRY